jgi:hypothetical protein
MFNLTAIYWIKDEARYLPEWIEFHLLQGYDHFILYDNGSRDYLLDVIKPYGDLIEIKFYPMNLTRPKNMWLSEQCCVEQRGRSKWLDFRSLDERVFCPDGRTVPEFLRDYEEFGGVAVGWTEFNSRGGGPDQFFDHVKRPEGLIIENYTQAGRDSSCHIKTIVRPETAVSFIGTPHNFTYLPGYYTVTENKVRVDGSHSPQDYTMNKIKCHHYRTMSREEFDIKMNKGVLDHGPAQENLKRTAMESEWVYHHFGVPERPIELSYNNDLVGWSLGIKKAVRARYTGELEPLLQFVNH